MAADLKDTPVAGLDAQLCGDAHLSNFGAFASPERRLLFDLNDFDETLPGPFEYDVKRMAASFTIAARNNGFSKADTRAATLASVRAYREAMAAFAQMGTMDIWYAHLDEDELRAAIRDTVAGTAEAKKPRRQRGRREEGEKSGEAGEGGQAGGEGGEDGREAGGEDRWRRRTPATACRRCPSSASWSTGQYRIVSQPPIVVPARDLAATYGLSPDEVGHGDPRAVPRLPGHPAGRPAPPAGALRGRGPGPQGGRRRQRRDPGVHRPAPGTRRAGPAVPADQGGDGIGSRAVRAARAGTGSTASGWCRGSG